MAHRLLSMIVISVSLMTVYSSVMGFPENLLLFSNFGRSEHRSNPSPYLNDLKQDSQEEETEENSDWANSALKMSSGSRLIQKKGGRSILFDLVDYVNKAKPMEGAGISSDVVPEKAPKSALWDVMTYSGK